MAWLHATPKPDVRSRRGKEQAATARRSRIDDLRRKKIDPPMPPNPAPHITDWLIELGLTEAAGMGAAVISSGEIAAWQSNMGISVEPWVARLIRELSKTYLAEGRVAESESCPPPWRAPVSQREIEIEEIQLRSLLG